MACYWTSSVGAGAEAAHPVHPDGCIDLLCDLSTGRLEIVGTMTRTLWVEDRGPTSYVAARFRPGGAAPLLRERADALTDRSIDAEALFGRRARELVDRMREATSLDLATQVLESFLLEMRVDPIEARIEHAASRLWSSPTTRVETITRELGVTRQHARRLFLEHVGVSPKAFAGLARAARALSMLSSDASLAHVARQAGYADQAHMTRELGRVAGSPPSKLRSCG